MKKRLFALAAAAVFSGVCCLPVELPASVVCAEEVQESCGTNAFFTFDDNTGTLTITGEGEFIGTAWQFWKTDIRRVEIGGSITKIGNGAFFGCTNLTAVEITAPLVSADNYAFASCTNLESITLPDSMQSIGDDAFASCTNLETVTLPDTLEKIGSYCFVNCSALTDINLPENVSIGNNAFSGADKLLSESDGLRLLQGHVLICYLANAEELVLPDYIDLIAGSAFNFHPQLRRVVLPEGIRSLVYSTFCNCENLESVEIPDTIERVEANAFYRCNALTEQAHTDDGMTLIDGKVLIGCDNNVVHLTLPKGTLLIADSALQRNLSVNIINCPESLRHIGANAFESSRICALQLNDGLQTIGENALSGCKYLTALNIPASVTEIGTQENLYLTDIYGTPGTAAEVFANENGIAFHNVAEQQLSGKDMSIIYGTDTWSIHNAGYDFNSEYYLTDAARRQLESAMSVYQEQLDEVWSGECFGLAIGLILVKAGVYTPSQIQTGAETLSQVTSDQAVQSFINYFHFMQFSDELLALSTQSKIEAQMMYTIIQYAKAVPNGGLPFLISMTFSDGGHAVVGYGQEEGTWEFDGITYDGRILIWDPNFPTAPNEDTYIYYDSSTFAYCIPYYKVQVDAGANGVIKRVCNDISVLNAHPYPFEQTSDIKGDVNCDGDVTLADAVLLAKIIAGVDGLQISADGYLNADMNSDGARFPVDLTLLLQTIAGSK